MTFKDIVMQRHAAKNFNGEKIEDAKIEELFELIRFAPSSFNIQPWKIKVINDQPTKEKLKEASWNQPQVSTCSHFLVFCADYDLTTLADQLESLMLEGGVPEEKVKMFLGMTRPFLEKMSEEQKISWAQRQTYIALGNAMNAAKALGFDSCPMEGIDPEKYQEILQLPENWVITCGLAVGYSDETPRGKLRFTKEQIFS